MCVRYFFHISFYTLIIAFRFLYRSHFVLPIIYPSPENSASGFFVYGLGWGVNQGILKDRKYKKAARKGWKALKSYVHEDGMLGYVQPVSAAPEQVTQNMTEVYGVGAFLMAGIEMLKMK